MAAKRRTKAQMNAEGLSPIPEKQQKAWEALVRKGKTLITQRDKPIWQLIELFGQVEAKYGEAKIERFADEIGIAKRTGYAYRKLSQLGVNKAFVEEYGEIGYSMVREILFHCGPVANTASQHFLKYAKEHQMTVRAMQAYMMDTAARNDARSEAQADIKVALASKQEMEGFPDVVKYELERMAEDHPELKDDILRTAIMDHDDVIELKKMAGLLSDEEIQMVEDAKRIVNKFKTMHRWLADNKKKIVANLEYGHEVTDDVRFNLERIVKCANEYLETETRTLDINLIKDIEEVKLPGA